MVLRTYTFGVRFRKGFKKEMLARQAGMDRYVYNKLLETFKKEYHRTGRVNATQGALRNVKHRPGNEMLYAPSSSGVTCDVLWMREPPCLQ